MSSNPSSGRSKEKRRQNENGSSAVFFFNRFSNAMATAKHGRNKAQGSAKIRVARIFRISVVTVIMALFGMTFIVQAVKLRPAHAEHDHNWRSPAGQQIYLCAGSRCRFCRNARYGVETLSFSNIREIVTIPAAMIDLTTNQSRPNYVKRVHRSSGDRIRMEGRNLIINGKLLPEHQNRAVDNNEQSAAQPEERIARKPGEPYDVYYNRFRGRELSHLQGWKVTAKEIVIPAGKYS